MKQQREHALKLMKKARLGLILPGEYMILTGFVMWIIALWSTEQERMFVFVSKTRTLLANWISSYL